MINIVHVHIHIHIHREIFVTAVTIGGMRQYGLMRNIVQDQKLPSELKITLYYLENALNIAVDTFRSLDSTVRGVFTKINL